MAPEVGERAEKAEPITFGYADGKLTIRQPQDLDAEDGPLDGIADIADGADDPQMKAMMEQMLADMKVAVRVNCEPGISKTNATHRDGNTITLMEMQFGKLLEQEGAIEKLSKVDSKDKEAMKKTIDAIDGIKVDLNEEIVVELD